MQAVLFSTPVRRAALCVALLAATTGHAASPSPVGLYRAHAGPDTASMLELTADGHFRYQLSEGALDEQASGQWRPTTEGAELTSDPRPKPAVFTLGPIGTTAEGEAFSLRVAWPNGEGIPGVDFRLGLADGEIVTDYTQSYGWSIPPGDPRQPAWVEFYEPIHGVASPRFPLPPRRAMAIVVTLEPNDIGTADFQKVRLSLDGDDVVLHWRDAEIRYARVHKGKSGDE